MAFEGVALPQLVCRDIAQVLIEDLVTSPGVLDWVMATRPVEERDAVRTALLRRPGKARLGHGYEAEEDWQVTVVLAGTRSAPRTLGDTIGGLEEVTFATAALLDEITSESTTLPVAMPEDLPAAGRVLLDEEIATYRHDGTTITLTARGVLGSPAAAHPTGAIASFHGLATRVGWQEDLSVRLDVLSSNTLLNTVLATALKAALIVRQGDFELAGCSLADVQESEITPRPQAWPAELLNYTLLVTLRRWMALPEELPVITETPVEVTPLHVATEVGRVPGYA